MTRSDFDVDKAIKYAKDILKEITAKGETTKSFLRNALNLAIYSKTYDEFEIRFLYLIARNKDNIVKGKNNEKKRKLKHITEQFLDRFEQNLEMTQEVLKKLVMLYYAKEAGIYNEAS